MSNSEAVSTAPEFASTTPDASPAEGIPTPNEHEPVPSETGDELARSQRIGAWVEVGATSLPAMLIALGSAAVGGVGLALRRRRRR